MKNITKKEFGSLLSLSPRSEQYKEIIFKIEPIIQNILNKLVKPKNGSKNPWVAYSNRRGANRGSFNPKLYKTSIIMIGGAVEVSPILKGRYVEGRYTFFIPTKWLWEDSSKIIEEFRKKQRQELADLKAKEKRENERIKRRDKNHLEKIIKKRENRNRLIESIKSKLEKEELKIVIFKRSWWC